MESPPPATEVKVKQEWEKKKKMVSTKQWLEILASKVKATKGTTVKTEDQKQEEEAPT